MNTLPNDVKVLVRLLTSKLIQENNYTQSQNIGIESDVIAKYRTNQLKKHEKATIRPDSRSR